MDNYNFTKGKWKYRYNGHDYCYDIVSDNEFICTTLSGNTKAKADALLISKSPLLLEFLQSIVSDYENGLIEDIEDLAIRSEQLIKEATEL